MRDAAPEACEVGSWSSKAGMYRAGLSLKSWLPPRFVVAVEGSLGQLSPQDLLQALIALQK